MGNDDELSFGCIEEQGNETIARGPGWKMTDGRLKEVLFVDDESCG